jgi:hypothetical protein
MRALLYQQGTARQKGFNTSLIYTVSSSNLNGLHLCEDFPVHGLAFEEGVLIKMPSINETDLFQLTIPEGCVMNKMIQPGNIAYGRDGQPKFKIACCLLKEEVSI